MRPYEKQEQAFRSQCLFSDVALLVCEARVPDSLRGRAEGPHCPAGRAESPHSHLCDGSSQLCEQAQRVREEATELWSGQLPLCIQVIAEPAQCTSSNSFCPTGALMLEKWVCQVQPRRHCRNADEALLPEQFLLQAIRSHLHFSLISAWLAKAKGKLPFRINYLTSLPGEQGKEPRSNGYRYSTHQFPSCQIGKALVLTVSVQSLPRIEDPPHLRCSCPHCPLPSDQFSDQPAASSRHLFCSSAGDEPRINRTEASAKIGSGHRQQIEAVSEVASTSEYLECSRSSEREVDNVRCAMDGVSLEQSRKSAGRCSDCSELEASNSVTFYISTEEQENNSQLFYSQTVSKGRSGQSSASATKADKKRLSQKILFSAEDDDVVLDDDFSDGEQEEVFAAVELLEKKKESSAEQKVDRKQPNTQGLTRAFVATQKSCLPRHLTEGASFSRITGLPLSSSPAPLKRNQHSFDYDTTLNTVAAIRSAFYHDHDSGSSDSESGMSLCKSAPASSNLLGNFEESALNGRIKPFGSIDGFTMDLAASGAFCPAHISLPVVTSFFSISEDNAPSPYLGNCNLEFVGKKGYHLPRKGTVQATLFNPQRTVVKMFVVRYDMSEMPSSCQTFVRQRTFFMPSTASLQDAQKNRSWLRYLIHLRFATSRSGKLYLHSDIRMLFSRKSELDANNLEVEPGRTAATTDAGNYELRSFTEMPKNPKFSPKKFGGQQTRF